MRAGAQAIAGSLDLITSRMQMWLTLANLVGRAMGLIPRAMPEGLDSRTGIGANIREAPTPMRRQFSDDVNAAVYDWARATEDIERNAGRARLEATEQYERQRTDTVIAYARGLARESEDFARQRARAETQHLQAMEKVRATAAQREATWASDLADKIADIREQSSRRVSDWQEDHNEKVAQVREDGAERLEKLETDYQRNREQALRQHRETLMGAAGRLDAAAVFAEQRRFALSQREAETAHRERTQEEQEQIDERLEQEQEAHAKRIAREERNLSERISQEQASHQKRLEDARVAEAQRLEEMQAAFVAQQAEEDEDRRLRLSRMATDHELQLAQMDTAQQRRLEQIDRQAADERTRLNDGFHDRLDDLGLFYEDWKTAQEEWQETTLENFSKMWRDMNRVMDAPWDTPGMVGYASGGPVRRTGPAMLHAGEFVLSPHTTKAVASMMGGFDQRSLMGAVGNRSSSLTVAEGAITIYASPGQSEGDIGEAVRRELQDFYQEMAA